MVESRPRGILSESDREHLQDPEERSPQARHKRERAIPERFENAIRDGTLLFEEWDADDRSAVFEENLEDPEFRNGIVDLLALVYAETHNQGMFEQLLYRAIDKAETQERDTRVTVDIDISVDPVPTIDLEDAFNRYASSAGGGRDISPEEAYQIAKFLRRSHAVGRGEVSEAMEYYNRTREETPMESDLELEDGEDNEE